jgi:hypothetical protein
VLIAATPAARLREGHRGQVQPVIARPLPRAVVRVLLVRGALHARHRVHRCTLTCVCVLCSAWRTAAVGVGSD